MLGSAETSASSSPPYRNFCSIILLDKSYPSPIRYLSVYFWFRTQAVKGTRAVRRIRGLLYYAVSVVASRKSYGERHTTLT